MNVSMQSLRPALRWKGRKMSDDPYKSFDHHIKAQEAEIPLLRDRIAELEAALEDARREGMEEAARIAENEPEPEGEPPIELHGRSVKNIAISSVRATKHSIAATIRAALEGGKI